MSATFTAASEALTQVIRGDAAANTILSVQFLFYISQSYDLPLSVGPDQRDLRVIGGTVFEIC